MWGVRMTPSGGYRASELILFFSGFPNDDRGTGGLLHIGSQGGSGFNRESATDQYSPERRLSLAFSMWFDHSRVGKGQRLTQSFGA